MSHIVTTETFFPLPKLTYDIWFNRQLQQQFTWSLQPWLLGVIYHNERHNIISSYNTIGSVPSWVEVIVLVLILREWVAGGGWEYAELFWVSMWPIYVKSLKFFLCHL